MPLFGRIASCVALTFYFVSVAINAIANFELLAQVISNQNNHVYQIINNAVPDGRHLFKSSRSIVCIMIDSLVRCAHKPMSHCPGFTARNSDEASHWF